MLNNVNNGNLNDLLNFSVSFSGFKWDFRLTVLSKSEDGSNYLGRFDFNRIGFFIRVEGKDFKFSFRVDRDNNRDSKFCFFKVFLLKIIIFFKILIVFS